MAAERMAAREAAGTEPDAFRRPVDLDGFAHVVGARGVEAAGTRKQR